MHGQRPYVLTIAGFDPSSGAGLTADIKTFEQNRVYGLAICTGLTQQTEDRFFSVQWRNLHDVEHELRMLLEKYEIAAVKFGIVPALEWLVQLTGIIAEKSTGIRIVVDPVWKSSTGFTFADFDDRQALAAFLKHIDLLTPNLDEAKKMAGRDDTSDLIGFLSRHASVLLKGGHNAGDKKGIDVLYEAGANDPVQQSRTILPNTIDVWPKHGSGCVLSAAIAAHLAMGCNVYEACVSGKRYTESFLASNPSLLGYHAA